jgi:peptidoglycan hydrolase-like amidase
MTASVVCFALAVAACSAQTVRIGVFGLFRPAELRLAALAGGALEVRAGAARFVVQDGAAASIAADNGAIECRWRGGAVRSQTVTASPRGGAGLVLAVPGKIERRFSGQLEITAAAGALEPVIAMDIEVAVASAVAAESPANAPIEALKAQAVVTRSYYAAAHGRHGAFDFCDTTHCQFLREPPRAGEPAARATLETRGLLLSWNGAPVAALYTASCGGHTRALDAAPPGDYPYYAVECPTCARGGSVPCAYCTRTAGAWANRRGTGAGHGVGLCQTGAAAMAAEGAGFRDILRYYFPNTAIEARR